MVRLSKCLPGTPTQWYSQRTARSTPGAHSGLIVNKTYNFFRSFSDKQDTYTKVEY